MVIIVRILVLENIFKGKLLISYFYTIEMIYVVQAVYVLEALFSPLFSTFQNNRLGVSILQKWLVSVLFYFCIIMKSCIEVYICYVSVLTVIVYIDEYNPELQ